MLNTFPQAHEFALTLGSVRDKVRVSRFKLIEGLSSIPRAEIELVSAASNLSFDDVMDQEAKLIIRDRQGAERVFEGLVSGFVHSCGSQLLL